MLLALLCSSQISKSSQHHKSFLFPSTTTINHQFYYLWMCELLELNFWNELQNASPKLKLTIKVKVYSQIHKLPSLPCHCHITSLYFFSIFTFLAATCESHTHTQTQFLSISEHHHIQLCNPFHYHLQTKTSTTSKLFLCKVQMIRSAQTRHLCPPVHFIFLVPLLYHQMPSAYLDFVDFLIIIGITKVERISGSNL